MDTVRDRDVLIELYKKNFSQIIFMSRCISCENKNL